MLKCGQTLTDVDAWRLFHIRRLASRVNDLRRAGHDIRTEMIGEGARRHARYSYRPPGELFVT